MPIIAMVVLLLLTHQYFLLNPFIDSCFNSLEGWFLWLPCFCSTVKTLGRGTLLRKQKTVAMMEEMFLTFRSLWFSSRTTSPNKTVQNSSVWRFCDRWNLDRSQYPCATLQRHVAEQDCFLHIAFYLEAIVARTTEHIHSKQRKLLQMYGRV